MGEGYNNEEFEKKKENCSRAQLNVAEYEGIFLALFLFLHTQVVSGATEESILMKVVCIVFPLCQFLYFWGRVVTGKPMPFAVIGALPRYIMMICSLVLLFQVLPTNKVTCFTGGTTEHHQECSRRFILAK